MDGVRTIEDQLIARDAAIFPGADDTRYTVVGAVFSAGGWQLEVFNVNRTAIETCLGVDLLYYNNEIDAWTSVQYKCTEKVCEEEETMAVYRPDVSFRSELGRMQSFRSSNPDKWHIGDGADGYRLCGDGFFFKFCTRIQLTVMSKDLLPGMYLPREFVECLLVSPASKGPKGGVRIKFDTGERHINNTLFADLVRDGWIGSRGLSSAAIANTVRAKLDAKQALVLARSRSSEEAADLRATLKQYGLTPAAS